MPLYENKSVRTGRKPRVDEKLHAFEQHMKVCKARVNSGDNVPRAGCMFPPYGNVCPRGQELYERWSRGTR